MIDRETVDRIYAAANIVDIIGEYVTLKRKGVNYQACCPFHNEKTPSFVVSPSKGVYKCFGCGKGGNAVTFLMEHENITYPEALKMVAKRYGIEVREKELSEEEIRRAREDAKKYEDDVAGAREFKDIMNEAESYVYKVENLLETRGAQLDMKEMKGIKSDCEYLKKLVTRTDMNHVDDVEMGRMKEAYRQLQESAEKLETM